MDAYDDFYTQYLMPGIQKVGEDYNFYNLDGMYKEDSINVECDEQEICQNSNGDEIL